MGLVNNRVLEAYIQKLDLGFITTPFSIQPGNSYTIYTFAAGVASLYDSSQVLEILSLSGTDLVGHLTTAPMRCIKYKELGNYWAQQSRTSSPFSTKNGRVVDDLNIHFMHLTTGRTEFFTGVSYGSTWFAKNLLT